MEHQFEGGTLTVKMIGRIDSNNAEAVGIEIDGICKECAGTISALIFDAGKLDYISSAGLRMVLKFRKQYANMKITNVSAEVYDIFDMTGFTEMIDIEKAYRQLSVDGCRVIGEGAKGTVYRYDTDIIVKVYKSLDSLPAIKNERELARKAFVLGIPTAISYDIVKVGEQFGSVFELLDAKSFSQLIEEDPKNLDKCVKMIAELLQKIHATSVKAGDMPDVKKLVNNWVETDMPFLEKEAGEKLKALVAAVPDTMNMLHGDYHSNNVMMQNGEAILIDMDTLSHGHPIFELANVYITYVGFGEENPKIVEKFVGFSFELAKEFWNKFLPLYLGTDDTAKIREVENKAKLLSYARMMRHTVRRGGNDTEAGRKTIALCKDRMESLLKEIDTLEF